MSLHGDQIAESRWKVSRGVGTRSIPQDRVKHPVLDISAQAYLQVVQDQKDRRASGPAVEIRGTKYSAPRKRRGATVTWMPPAMREAYGWL